MRHRIDIKYDPERMRSNRLRLENTYSGRPVDRVPVIMGIEARYTLRARGRSFEDYYKNPEAHLIEQLENQKWILENIDDDRCTGPGLAVFPDFQNVVGAAGFGAEVIWREDNPPAILHCINNIEETESLICPRPEDGFWKMKLDWFTRMQEAAKDVELFFNGERAEVHTFLNIGGEGPFQIAVDLVGEKFFWWLYEYPEQCRKFLRKITDSKMLFEDRCRELYPSGGEYWFSEDTAQMISESMYREFCLPYDEELYSRYGGRRVMHLCGKSTHLLKLLVEDLKIDVFHGLNKQVPADTVRAILKPSCVVIGNLSPLTILQGSTEDVAREVRDCIECFAPDGRLVLSDGYSVMPDSPLENINCVVKTAQEAAMK